MANVSIYPEIKVECKMEHKESYMCYLMNYSERYVNMNEKRRLLELYMVDYGENVNNGEFKINRLVDPQMAKVANQLFDKFKTNPTYFDDQMKAENNPRHVIGIGAESALYRFTRSQSLPFLHTPHNSWTCPTVVVPYAEIQRMLASLSVAERTTTIIEYVTEAIKRVRKEAEQADWKVDRACYIKGCNTTRTRSQARVLIPSIQPAGEVQRKNEQKDDIRHVARLMIKFMDDHSSPEYVRGINHNKHNHNDQSYH